MKKYHTYTKTTSKMGKNLVLTTKSPIPPDIIQKYNMEVAIYRYPQYKWCTLTERSVLVSEEVWLFHGRFNAQTKMGKVIITLHYLEDKCGVSLGFSFEKFSRKEADKHFGKGEAKKYWSKNCKTLGAASAVLRTRLNRIT